MMSRCATRAAATRGEVFRNDKMGRLAKTWYEARNSNGFPASNPVQGMLMTTGWIGLGEDLRARQCDEDDGRCLFTKPTVTWRVFRKGS